jgi:methylenetetrahydrofolate reductase (NADPH)
MRKNLWGINISDEIIDRLDKSEDSTAEGEKICIEIIEQMKNLPGIDGVHLMGPNCESQSANIIKALS